MAGVERLITLVELDERNPGGNSARAHLYAVLAGGRRLVLLDDRGWGSSAPIAAAGRRSVEDTARMVVGPDGPGVGQTDEQMTAGYWQFLERKLRDAGVDVSSAQLMRLPHDVEIGEHLRRELGLAAGPSR